MFGCNNYLHISGDGNFFEEKLAYLGNKLFHPCDATHAHIVLMAIFQEKLI